MSRHPLRITPLIVGLLFIVLAVMFALDAGGDADVDARWVPATALIGLGLALVLGGLQRSRRATATTPAVAADPGADDADRTEPVTTADRRDGVATPGA